MYVYFDRNGVLKEIITDRAFRVGDSQRDKIYIYWEGSHSVLGGWAKYRLPNGEMTPEMVFEITKVGKELPTKPLRNLRYFSYDHTYTTVEDGETVVHTGYEFYELTVPDEVLSSAIGDDRLPTENNLVALRVRFVIGDTIEALGTIVFSVETNMGLLSDSSINETQYNYLLKLINLGDLANPVFESITTGSITIGGHTFTSLPLPIPDEEIEDICDD